LSAAATPAVEFASDLQAAVNSRATVDVSVDGGTTWTNAWSSAASVSGQVVVQLPQAAHQARVRVRFGYVGQWSKWWAVDNVFVGNRVCTAAPGGLVVGEVTDTAGTGIDGATVTSVTNPDQHTMTIATPDDPNTGDGLYRLFSTAGPQQFTAAKPGYTSRTTSTTVTADQLTSLNFTLPTP
jgi:hypothetical protein